MNTNNFSSSQDATEINNSAKIDLLEKYEKELSAIKPSDQGQNAEVVKLTAIVMGLVLLLKSEDAHAVDFNALIEKFAEQISTTLTDQLTPMFENIMAIFSGDWGSLMQSEGDKTTVTLGKVGDSVNQVSKTIEQERIKRATAPRPNACELDDAAEEEKQTKEEVKQVASEKKKKDILKYKDETPKEDRPGLMKVASLINTPNANINDSINPSVFDKDILTDVDKANAENYIEILKASASEGLTIRGYNPEMSNGSAIKQSKIASKIAHIELATSVFTDDISRKKMNSNGSSEHLLRKKQIDKTYFSEAWREGIHDLADPTPLLIDMTLQTATTNKLLLDMVEGQVLQNKLMSSLILNANERN
jgi:hypothetical protein